MALVPLKERIGMCPYCYDGIIMYDKICDLFYCSYCSTNIKILNYKVKKND